jgi:putative membrane protein
MMPYGWMHGYGYMGLWGGLIGMILNIAVIVGIVWLVVWAVRRLSGGHGSDSRQTPTEILQARYARGEITREQYQQMLKDLG